MFTVSAEPRTAFVDAISARLTGDAALLAIVTGGVLGQLSQAARTTPPYLVLGRTHLDRAFGPFVPGCLISLEIDGWSSAKGPYEMERILSRVSVLLERTQTLPVTGFEYVRGSLTAEMSDVEWEPDPDKPESGFYRGSQRWLAELHELV